MARHLITTIPQIDGGHRELYAATAKAAREAREQIRHDPAMVDHVDVSERVEVSRDGRRIRYYRIHRRGGRLTPEVRYALGLPPR